MTQYLAIYLRALEGAHHAYATCAINGFQSVTCAYTDQFWGSFRGTNMHHVFVHTILGD